MFHSASIPSSGEEVQTQDMEVDDKPHDSVQRTDVGDVEMHPVAREIAAGAVVREKKERGKRKDWQVAKLASATITDDQEERESDNGVEDAKSATSAQTRASSGTAAPIRNMLVRRLPETRNVRIECADNVCLQSQRRKDRRTETQQPVHLSLHNHNYHFPSQTYDPSKSSDSFNFGPTSLSIPSPYTPSVDSKGSIPQPSTWWREEGPYILLGYLQFAFNLFLVLLGLYLLISFVIMLRGDISDRTKEVSMELHQSILHCSEAYMANRCAPETRVPAMDRSCREWEHCMNRNPKVVGVARVGAETLAEVVNGFVETVSWRTMVSATAVFSAPHCDVLTRVPQLFLLAVLFLIISFTNTTITSYRRSHTQYHAQHEQQLAHERFFTQHLRDATDRPSLTHAGSAPAMLSLPKTEKRR